MAAVTAAITIRPAPPGVFRPIVLQLARKMRPTAGDGRMQDVQVRGVRTYRTYVAVAKQANKPKALLLRRCGGP